MKHAIRTTVAAGMLASLVPLAAQMRPCSPTSSETSWAASSDPAVVTEDAKLVAPGVGLNDHFGGHLALAEDTVLVGSSSDFHHGQGGAGSAYVFVRTGGRWILQDKLVAFDAAKDDNFGRSVSLSGDTAVVGANFDDHASGTNAGSAYVFVHGGSGWHRQAKLIASDAAEKDWFGISVAVSGDTAIVGAVADDQAAGSAYVFVRSGIQWSQQAKLVASDAAASDGFGLAVALSGDTAIVGAYGDDHGGWSNAGSVYVFERSGSGWTQSAKLTASDASNHDFFGSAVALSGDTVIVGAYTNNPAGMGEIGSAYVFVRTGNAWSQQAKLNASDAADNDYFGYSVALAGDTALVGALQDDHSGGAHVGSAYVFARSGSAWRQEAKLIASDAASGDHFGTSVALSGNTAIVGAFNDDHEAGIDAGSAYVFGRQENAWEDLGHGLAGTTGVPLLEVYGTLVGGDPVGLTLSDAKGSAPVFLFLGPAELGFSPFFGGTLVPDFTVSPGQIILLSTHSGGGLFLATTWPFGVPGGFEIYLQCWITDAGAPFGFSASNAIKGTTP